MAFATYIDRLHEAVLEAIERHDAESIKLDGMSKRNDRIHADKTASAEAKTAADYDFREAVRVYKNAVMDIQADLTAKAAKLHDDLVEEQDVYLGADPVAVDQNTVLLLNSGALSDTDLVVLARRFSLNPTMLKLIKNKAETDFGDSRVARMLAVSIADYVSPDSRLDVLSTAARVAAKTVDTKTSVAAAFQKEWSDNFRQSFRSTMERYDDFSAEVI